MKFSIYVVIGKLLSLEMDDKNLSLSIGNCLKFLESFVQESMQTLTSPDQYFICDMNFRGTFYKTGANIQTSSSSIALEFFNIFDTYSVDCQ